MEKQSSLGKSTLIHYSIPDGQPWKYIRTSNIIQTVQVVSIPLGIHKHTHTTHKLMYTCNKNFFKKEAMDLKEGKKEGGMAGF